MTSAEGTFWEHRNYCQPWLRWFELCIGAFRATSKSLAYLIIGFSTSLEWTMALHTCEARSCGAQGASVCRTLAEGVQGLHCLLARQ